jgi:hypothetical protein
MQAKKIYSRCGCQKAVTLMVHFTQMTGRLFLNVLKAVFHLFLARTQIDERISEARLKFESFYPRL